MLFKDYKNTEEFMYAHVVEFVDTNGNEIEIDNIDDETLDDICVVDTYMSSGFLQIILN